MLSGNHWQHKLIIPSRNKETRLGALEDKMNRSIKERKRKEFKIPEGFNVNPIYMRLAEKVREDGRFSFSGTTVNHYVDGCWTLDENGYALREFIGSILHASVYKAADQKNPQNQPISIDLSQKEAYNLIKEDFQRESKFRKIVEATVDELQQTIQRGDADFDKDFDVINASNDVVNLANGYTIPHSKEQLNRMQTRTNYIQNQTFNDSRAGISALERIKQLYSSVPGLFESFLSIMASLLYRGNKKHKVIIFWGDQDLLHLVRSWIEGIFGDGSKDSDYLAKIPASEIADKREPKDLRRILAKNVSKAILLIIDSFKGLDIDDDWFESLIDGKKKLFATQKEDDKGVDATINGTIVIFGTSVPDFKKYKDSLMEKIITIPLCSQGNYDPLLEMQMQLDETDTTVMDRIFTELVHNAEHVIRYNQPIIHQKFAHTFHLLISGRANTVLAWASELFRVPESEEEYDASVYSPEDLFNFTFRHYEAGLPKDADWRAKSKMEFIKELDLLHDSGFHVSGFMLYKHENKPVFYYGLYLKDESYYKRLLWKRLAGHEDALYNDYNSLYALEMHKKDINAPRRLGLKFLNNPSIARFFFVPENDYYKQQKKSENCLEVEYEIINGTFDDVEEAKKNIPGTGTKALAVKALVEETIPF
jgi:hypothetical protein